MTNVNWQKIKKRIDPSYIWVVLIINSLLFCGLLWYEGIYSLKGYSNITCELEEGCLNPAYDSFLCNHDYCQKEYLVYKESFIVGQKPSEYVQKFNYFVWFSLSTALILGYIKTGINKNG